MNSRALFCLLVLPLLCGISYGSDSEESGFRNFTKKSYILSDSDYKRISEQVRHRGNIPQMEFHSYPWYYHYELGLEMKKKNDWQRALESFLDALDHRQKPSKLARTYGVWFINYHPYYEIGLAHYHLGNWSCAVNAFQLSENLETLPPKSSAIRELQTLKADAISRMENDPQP